MAKNQTVLRPSCERIHAVAEANQPLEQVLRSRRASGQDIGVGKPEATREEEGASPGK